MGISQSGGLPVEEPGRRREGANPRRVGAGSARGENCSLTKRLSQGNCRIRVLRSNLDYLVSIRLLLASASYEGGQDVEQGGLIIPTAYLIAERSDFHPPNCTAVGSPGLKAQIRAGTSSCLLIHPHFSSADLSPSCRVRAGGASSASPAAAQRDEVRGSPPRFTPGGKLLCPSAVLRPQRA